MFLTMLDPTITINRQKNIVSQIALESAVSRSRPVNVPYRKPWAGRSQITR